MRTIRHAVAKAAMMTDLGRRLVATIQRRSTQDVRAKVEQRGGDVWTVWAGETINSRAFGITPHSVPGSDKTGVFVAFNPGYIKVYEINSTYRGVGSAMMEEVLLTAREVGVSRVILSDWSGGWWNKFKAKHPDIEWVT